MIALKFTKGLLLAAAIVISAGANALDKVRVAGTQRNLWDGSLFFNAERAKGIFKEQGIELDVLWTQGGSECEQPVITGSMDICMDNGIVGAIGAWAKGAPIAIISAAMTGAADVWWYAKAESGINSIKDTNGKTVAFSRPSSSTHLLLNAMVAATGATPKLVGAGGPAPTLTQVMSGQIDVGWSAGIFAADLLKQGKIKRVANGNDAPGAATQTVRVNIANTSFLKAKPDVAKRFMAAYRKTVEWGYSDPRALEMYAEDNKSTVEIARAARDDMYPKASMAVKPVVNIELSIRQAIADKRLSAPLTPDQIRELLRYVNELNP